MASWWPFLTFYSQGERKKTIKQDKDFSFSLEHETGRYYHARKSITQVHFMQDLRDVHAQHDDDDDDGPREPTKKLFCCCCILFFEKREIP